MDNTIALLSYNAIGQSVLKIPNRMSGSGFFSLSDN